MKEKERYLFCLGQGSNGLHMMKPYVAEGWFKAFSFCNQNNHSNLAKRAQDFAHRLSHGSLRQQGINQQVIFGHSAGAITALDIASRVEEVEQVILLAPGPLPGMTIPAHLWPHLMRGKYLLPVLLGNTFMLDKQTNRQLLLNKLSDADFEAVQPHMTVWSGKIVRRMLGDFLHYAIHNSWMKRVVDTLRTRGVRIVVAYGTGDMMIPYSFAEDIAELLSAETNMFINAHHMMMVGDKDGGESEHWFDATLRLIQEP